MLVLVVTLQSGDCIPVSRVIILLTAGQQHRSILGPQEYSWTTVWDQIRVLPLTWIIVSNERGGTINPVNGQIIQTRAVKLHSSSRSHHSDYTAAILSSSGPGSIYTYYLLRALQPPSIYFWTWVRTALTARQRGRKIFLLSFIPLCSRIGTNQTRKDQCWIRCDVWF